MTWQRHRPKNLSWTLLGAFVLVLGFSVWRYTLGGVPAGEDLVGVGMRIAVLVLIVLLYLRTGGTTSADADGLAVHDGVRRTVLTRDQIDRVAEHPRRKGAVVALLRTGKLLDLPGVPVADLGRLRRALRVR